MKRSIEGLNTPLNGQEFSEFSSIPGKGDLWVRGMVGLFDQLSCEEESESARVKRGCGEGFDVVAVRADAVDKVLVGVRQEQKTSYVIAWPEKSKAFTVLGTRTGLRESGRNVPTGSRSRLSEENTSAAWDFFLLDYQEMKGEFLGVEVWVGEWPAVRVAFELEV